ncbi:phage portal protein [Sphingomonas immobilis]|uniref:Phage portal protein n=1 Tax=Sphingomonas immobilis TaxID=3063997 RepID=A0ABT9A0U9_9SPHN|nr:phage portal protein [Sphingomonas sp. CA1-15]MDO7843445.1 phage portal protein [Sphingomonas sp. CA1-15]
MALSPDDYRRAAGGRRSHAPRATVGPPTLAGPVLAYTGYDLSDPALLEMMRGDGGRTGVAGVAINERRALRNSTFFRAMSLQCGSMGMLPLHLRKRDGRNTEKATDHPLYNVLLRKPNDFQTASRFKSYMQLCALLDGNAYALKVRSRGAVRQLIPLPRRRVKPRLTDTYDLVFDYDRPQGGQAVLSADDVFHFGTPLTLDGINGISLLDIAADTLGLSLVAQQAAGRLLTKGSMARGALETADTLGDEAYDHLKASLRENYAGSGAEDDWMILEEGLTAKPFGSNARDAQLVEIMKREAEEVARFTGVPRPLLMFDETSWGSGIEQLSLFFITYCLMPWFVIWEEAIWTWLLTPAEQQTLYAKFNEGALLRGSMKDQAEFLKAALGPNAAYLTPNEARDFMDRNPLPDGDDLPRPGTTAATMMQEEKPDAA